MPNRLITMTLLMFLWGTWAEALPPAEVTMTKVRDGDTLEVTDGQAVYVIRLIGVSASELNSIVPCAKAWAEAAKEYLTKLVTDVDRQPLLLRLEFDRITQDVYKRWLAYVYVGELMANAMLIQQGYAAEVDSGKNRRYRDRFRQLEREAEIHGRGMWGN